MTPQLGESDGSPCSSLTQIMIVIMIIFSLRGNNNEEEAGSGHGGEYECFSWVPFHWLWEFLQSATLSLVIFKVQCIEEDSEGTLKCLEGILPQ
nr:hypothetical protein CFP56_42995 [Quercus suber]